MTAPKTLPMQWRTLQIERDALATRAEGDERIPITLSSDSPVRRWWGVEILEHSAAAIDLSRAAAGLSFLVNHRTDEVAGRVEDIALRKDGKLAGMLRFGRSALAQEIRQDIEDGIRPDISVGYSIERLTLIDETDGVETYTAKRWTPMEVSTVPVPADVTVGVGRDAERAAFPVAVESPEPPARETETMSESKVETPTPAGVVGESREAEAKLIAQAARTFKMERALPEWISEGLTLDQVRGKIEAEQVRAANDATPPGHVDLTANEERAYNPLNAIMAIADGKWDARGGLEKEVSDVIAGRTGKPSKGFYLPMNIRASVTGNEVGTASLGGNAVETQLVGFIDILRNRMLVRQLGATIMTGLKGNLAIPRQITANSFAWVGENPSSEASLTELTLDQVTLSPKVGMGATAYSRLAGIQTSPDVASMVLNDLARTAAIGIDFAALNNVGGAGPTGVRGTSNINTKAIGTHGGALSWAILVGAETEVAVDNADFGSMAWVTTPGVRGAAKQILKSTTAGAQYLWSDDNRMNGYAAHATNQMPTNLTKGTSTTICHAAIFGNWSQLLIGEWGGALDILVDPYSYAKQNMIGVYSYANVDVAVRHPAAFCLTADILP